MTHTIIEGREAVIAALEDPDFVPPPRPGRGDALRLRAAMARFSAPADHAARREAVVAAIARIDVDAAATAAATLTSSLLAECGDEVEAVSQLAARVPTAALVACLDAGEPTPMATPASFDTYAAVAAMVEVIGHGASPTPGVDRGVGELVRRYGVDGASMLYQNHDATAALITTLLVARVTGAPAVPAVPRTKRVRAVRHGCSDDGADEVTVEIGAAGLPFGAGPHRCPGEQLAAAIAAAVVDAVAAAGYVPDLDRVAYDGDDRPRMLPLVRGRGIPPLPSS